MRPRSQHREPADYENLGKAFEGLAGALHDGHPIEAPDLHEACRLAHELWPVRGGGHQAYEKEFESARLECRTLVPLATSGDLRAWAALERACFRVGAALRWKGRTIDPRGSAAARPWPKSRPSRQSIQLLDQRYARYALRPILLPM